MNVHHEHVIDCSAERFWEVSFDPNFVRAAKFDMGALNWEVLERSTEGRWEMRTRMTPANNFPAFARKLVGSMFHFEEHLVREIGSDTAICHITPSALADRAHMRYELRVVPEGPDACRRIMDWTIEIKVPGIGAKLEKFAAGEVRRDLETMARYWSQHANERKAA